MPLNDVALNLPELKQFNHPLYKYCPHALMKDEWDSRIKNREKAVVNADSLGCRREGNRKKFIHIDVHLISLLLILLL